MLNLLELKGFKGVTAKFEKLGRINIISGPNGSGKTAILDAIQVALVGYVPRLGKKATTDLMAGKFMSVRAEFGDHQRTMRWIDTKLSQDCVPEVEFSPAELLDLAEFEKRTAADRVQYLLSRIPPSVERPSPESVLEPILLSLAHQSERTMVLEVLQPIEGRDIYDRLGRWREVADGRVSITKSDLESAKRVVASVETDAASGGIESVAHDPSQEIAELRAQHDATAKQARSSDILTRDLQSKLEGIVRNGKAIKQEVADKIAGCPCPTCGTRRTTMTPEDAAAYQATKEKDLDTMRAEAAALKQQIDKESQKTQDLNGEVLILNGKISGLNATRDRWVAATGRQAVIEKARTQIDELEVAHDTWKRVAAAVKKQISEVTKRGVDSVMAMANLLIEPVMGFRIRYNGAEFVKEDSGHIFKMFSKAEEAVVSAGLRMAFTTELQNRIMVIDDLEAFRSDSYDRLMPLIGRLIEAGTIHQFFAAQPEVPRPVEGLTINTITRPEK